jgi:hypothetical protein
LHTDYRVCRLARERIPGRRVAQRGLVAHVQKCSLFIVHFSFVIAGAASILNDE